MTQRVLFLVNGLGLGNSTRCHAVIAELLAAGAEVEVVTSDNGLWFFAGEKSLAGVTPIPSLHYGQKGGRISIGATLGQAGQMLSALRRVDAVVAAAIDRFRPQVVVADSVYCFRPARRAGLPLVALNNSDIVGRTLARLRDWPPSILPQFLFVELADYLYHRNVPDLVISPRLDPADRSESGPFRRVGPIVRRDCRPTGPSAGRLKRVAIMLSGSVFGSRVAFRRRHPGLHIDVLGRPAPDEQGKRMSALGDPGSEISVTRWPDEAPAGLAGDQSDARKARGANTEGRSEDSQGAGWPRPALEGPTSDTEGVTYHGKVRDSLRLLAEADLVVVNGGFSAVSEALMMAKPMVVIPVPRHAEQWVNGRIVRQLGVGVTAGEAELEDAMEHALARFDDLRAGYRDLPVQVNGSLQAADMILTLAGGRRRCG